MAEHERRERARMARKKSQPVSVVIQRKSNTKRKARGRKFEKGNRTGFASHPENINRHGRPKTHDQLRKLIQTMGAEVVEGSGLTRIELKMRAMYASKSATDNANLIEHGWGRVPVEVTGRDGGPIEIKGFKYGVAIANIAPRPVADSESPGSDQIGGDGQALGENADGE